MNLLKKKKQEVRPRLSMNFEFLLKMSRSEQDEWLATMNDCKEENAVLMDQLKALENAVSDTLKRNGELTKSLSEIEKKISSEVRTEMNEAAYNRVNEGKVKMFDEVLEIVRAVRK
nr:hypothetical protein [uncultured Flavobacterium sp.]